MKSKRRKATAKPAAAVCHFERLSAPAVHLAVSFLAVVDLGALCRTSKFSEAGVRAFLSKTADLLLDFNGATKPLQRACQAQVLQLVKAHCRRIRTNWMFQPSLDVQCEVIAACISNNRATLRQY